MRHRRRTRSPLVALGLVAILLGGVVLWSVQHSRWSLLRHGDGGPRPPLTTSREAPADTVLPAIERAADAADRARDESGARDEGIDVGRVAAMQRYAGEGSIELRVIDATTRAPLADLPVVVWSERPHTHVFACGLTDDEGRLLVERLPEDVVIFETPRRAPHANTIAAIWLSEGQHRSFTMEVGYGGAATGRVVDDLGQPLAGVEVGADPQPGGQLLAADVELQWREPDAPLAQRLRQRFEGITTTDAEGRYQVDAIRSRAGAIWITDDGQMDPRREEPIKLRFRRGQTTRTRDVLVNDGATVELPDVVFDRHRTFEGVVVDDATGAPIAGALVTAGARYILSQRAFDRPWTQRGLEPVALLSRRNPGLDALAPWEAGFALAAEEAITDAAGRFELVTSSDNRLVLVVAPDWRRRELSLPKVAPGERAAPLEIRLRSEMQFFVRVTEADGAPLQVKKRLDSGWLLQILVSTRDGRRRAGQLFNAGDSTFGVAASVDADEVTRLQVRTAEHRPAEFFVTVPPRDRPTFEVQLERRRLHLLTLDLAIADPTDTDEVRYLAGLPLSIGALKLPLAELQAQETSAAGDGWWSLLQARSDIAALPDQRVLMQLPVGGPWHVVVSGPWGEANQWFGGPIELGVFEPRAEPYSVTLPPVSAAWRERLEEGLARQARGKEPPKPGRLLAWFVDAATGQPIATDSLYTTDWSLDRFPSPRRWRRKGGPDEPFTAEAAPGEWTLRFESDRFRPPAPRTVVVASEQEHDLGTIALEPKAEQRLRVFEADGTTAAANCQVSLFDAAADWRSAVPLAQASTNSDGLVTLHADLPPVARLRLMPKRSPGPLVVPPTIELELPAWPAGEPLPLTLPPRFALSVEIDQSAIDPDVRDAPCEVHVFAADGEPRAPIAGATPLEPRDDDDPALRRFALELPPGRWRLVVRSALLVAEELVVEISDEISDAAADAPNRAPLRLVARPR